MQRIRVLIVDDEQIAREGLRTLLASEPDVEIVGECRNGREAIKAIHEKEPDLVLLDVQMPQLSGFDVIERVGVERMPAVVFVTAYDQYALRAFEINALDYLLKPFDEERFRRTLDRARRFFEREGLQDLRQRLSVLLEALDERKQKRAQRLVVKSAGRIFFVNVDEIDWIEAAGNYVALHVGRESHLLRETMNAMEGKLGTDSFVRIRRSAIVNVARIKELRPLFKGEYQIILRDGTRLTSSRRYRDQVNSLLKEPD